MEAPWPITLVQRSTRQRNKHKNMTGDGGSLREGEAGEHRRRGTRNRKTSQGLTLTWEQAEGGKGGGHKVTGHGDICRHAALGAETSSGGWWLVGAGNVQVDDASCRERRWGAVAKERGYDNKC